jgi:hypothetical protein
MPKMPKIREEKTQKETPYHENTKEEGLYRTVGRFSCFPAFVLS